MLWFDICSGKHLARSRLVDDLPVPAGFANTLGCCPTPDSNKPCPRNLRPRLQGQLTGGNVPTWAGDPTCLWHSLGLAVMGKSRVMLWGEHCRWAHGSRTEGWPGRLRTCGTRSSRGKDRVWGLIPSTSGFREWQGRQPRGIHRSPNTCLALTCDLPP